MSQIQLTHVCTGSSALRFPLNMFSFQLSCMQMTAHLKNKKNLKKNTSLSVHLTAELLTEQLFAQEIQSCLMM